MRYDQPDEADDTAGRHACRGQERGREVDHSPQPIHFCSKVVRGLVAQGDQIERAGMIEDQDHWNGRIHREDSEGTPGCGTEPAQQPEEGIPDPWGIGQHHDRTHECAGKGSDDDTREEQHVGIEMPARYQAEPVDQRHRAEGTDERSHGHGPGAACLGGDRDHGPEPGAARKPEEIWLRQGVPDHGLQRGAADAEAAADQKGENHPRSTEVTNDD
jgi:hypothetical protein